MGPRATFLCSVGGGVCGYRGLPWVRWTDGRKTDYNPLFAENGTEREKES